MEDLQRRAEIFVKGVILPHLSTPQTVTHVAIVTHTLCMMELVAAMVRLDPKAEGVDDWRGYKNTAWTTVKLSRVSILL